MTSNLLKPINKNKPLTLWIISLVIFFVSLYIGGIRNGTFNVNQSFIKTIALITLSGSFLIGTLSFILLTIRIGENFFIPPKKKQKRNKPLLLKQKLIFLLTTLAILLPIGSNIYADFKKRKKYNTKTTPTFSPNPTPTPTPIPTKTPTSQHPHNTNSYQAKHNGTRTGKIIKWNEFCTGKTISIYENELIAGKADDGKTYYMTQKGWDCYHNWNMKKTTPSNTKYQYLNNQKIQPFTLKSGPITVTVTNYPSNTNSYIEPTTNPNTNNYNHDVCIQTCVTNIGHMIDAGYFGDPNEELSDWEYNQMENMINNLIKDCKRNCN